MNKQALFILVLTAVGIIAGIFAINVPKANAQFQPCVLPNRCVTAAPVATCQWPNTCG